MKTNLLFDFSVNKENRTIHVSRGFNAALGLVWQAWTTAELLDQWWGPKPWRAETKSMDFSVGGHWLYAMVGPAGERHWSKVNYLAITEEASFTAMDGFCDEHGTMNPQFPQNKWENHFSENEGGVRVDILLSFDTREDLEKIIEMGFQEGFTMGLQQLDDLLVTLEK